MKKVSFEIGREKVEGFVAFSQGKFWMHVGGETFTHDVVKRDSRRSGKKAMAHSPGEVLAPMPGKIIKTLVKEGASVSLGQVLLVMEAMKMEYTLKAQADGVVSKIECEAGQQVVLGQILVKLDVQ